MSDHRPATLPAGACDTHIHFYDARYPVAPTALLQPPDATPAMYQQIREAMGLSRVVVVQPTTYGLDNRCQIAAAGEFGDDARLVVVVDEHVDESALAHLHSVGARGARFHMLPGGALEWAGMPAVAARIAELGWHVQVQLNGRELPERVDLLSSLACPVVIDHVGRFMPPVGPDDASFAALLRLLDTGCCWVKLSAPYESVPDQAPDHAAVSALVERLVERHPERMLWATNWPHPGQAAPPAPDALATLLSRWLPTATLRSQVLVDNPATLYQFVTPPTHSAQEPNP